MQSSPNGNENRWEGYRIEKGLVPATGRLQPRMPRWFATKASCRERTTLAHETAGAPSAALPQPVTRVQDASPRRSFLQRHSPATVVLRPLPPIPTAPRPGLQTCSAGGGACKAGLSQLRPLSTSAACTRARPAQRGRTRHAPGRATPGPAGCRVRA